MEGVLRWTGDLAESFLSRYRSANLGTRWSAAVDTAERGERCFTDVTERFRELAGEAVRVEFGPRQEDRYGRLVLGGFGD